MVESLVTVLFKETFNLHLCIYFVSTKKKNIVLSQFKIVTLHKIVTPCISERF